MTNSKLEAIKRFNEANEREEVLYVVMVYKFKLQHGCYVYQPQVDSCFHRTNCLEEAKAKYKEACDHAPLDNTYPYFLIEIQETEIIDNEAVFTALEGYNHTNTNEDIKIEW